MTVNPNTLAVGVCYITPAGQVRKITDITTTGGVNYDARGGHNVDGWHPGPQLSNLPSKAKFASDVDREVKCTYHPDYPE
ncbi:hypothetical protein SAMN02799636_05127 [Methylobacterium sp. 275MFSha3.1]|uniref:hypothetical protein n=1 Tax=Methylobacterium sp. 275MFSha3.1 TaxID=1502746 RepID=UPI0008A810F3|nr:hypothetical protein [Methylobacterium sp. 275MFSha3.1]SEI04402.1 hypothetical protein SAMN02799636_05127 [Methylobacterium sp. 275MFSha3.1]